MKSRIVLFFVLGLACFTASGAFAKDLCVQFNSGTFAGSQVIMKKVTLKKSTFGPVYGYWARYFSTTGEFNFSPIHGSSVVNASGTVAIGIEVPNVGIMGTAGSFAGSGDPMPIVLTCVPGANGKIDELDGCSGQPPASMHVITCSDAVEIP